MSQILCRAGTFSTLKLENGWEVIRNECAILLKFIVNARSTEILFLFLSKIYLQGGIRKIEGRMTEL